VLDRVRPVGIASEVEDEVGRPEGIAQRTGLPDIDHPVLDLGIGVAVGGRTAVQDHHSFPVVQERPDQVPSNEPEPAGDGDPIMTIEHAILRDL
jgi:hypothetical protein